MVFPDQKATFRDRFDKVEEVYSIQCSSLDLHLILEREAHGSMLK